MKIRLGLVGPDDAIKLISDVIKEYEDTFDYVTLTQTIYTENIAGMINNIKEHIEKVDVFLFSGQLPYTIVTNNLDIPRPCFFVPHNTTCIYKTLWQIREEGIPLDKISFDMIKPKEITEALHEVGLEESTVYASEYEEGKELDPMDIAEWHFNLWKSGKIGAAITCLYSTYQALKAKNVPSFRALYPKATIRQTLEQIINDIARKRLKVMQIAVMLVNIDNFNAIAKSRGSEYAVQKIKIELLNILLDFAQTIQGSVFSFGGDDYIIFTTRGALLSGTNSYSNISLMNQVRQDLKISISCGIGFGKTVYESERNARFGLSYAKDASGDCIYVVEEDGSMTGPLGKPYMLNYSLRTQAEIVKIANSIGLSSTHVSKLRSIRDQIGEETISASKLAPYLNITERSARRILKILADKGYAVEVGEEASGKKGRPRKTYSLNL